MKQPRDLWVVVGYGLLAATWAGVLSTTRLPDRLLLPLIIPIVGAALFYPRRVYLPMLFLLMIAGLVTAYQISPDLDRSLETLIAEILTVLAVIEMIHALAIARRQAEVALLQREDQLRHRNLQLMALGVIAESTSRSLDVQAILRDSGNAVLAAFRLPAAWTFLVRDNYLELIYQQGLAASLDERYPLDQICYDLQVLSKGFPQLILDAQAFPERDQAILDSSGLACHVAIPLPGEKGQVLGVLCAGSDTLVCFDKDALDLLLNAGRQIGLALHRAQLYADTLRHLADVRALAQASVHLTAELDPQAIMAAVMGQALAVLDADRVSLFLFNGTSEQDALVQARGLSDVYLVAFQDFVYNTPDWQVLGGETLWIEDVQSADLAGPLIEMAQGQGYRTAVLLPLRWGAETSGVLGLYFDELRPCDKSLLDLAHTFANQSAVAIKNSQLFDQLRATEARYRGLFEGNSDPIVVADLDGTILDVNPAARRLVGEGTFHLAGQSVMAYPPILKAILGAQARHDGNDREKVWSNSHREQSAERLRQGIRHVLAGKTRHLEINVPVDGETQTLELRVERVDYAGRLALQWTAHDITAQRDLAHWREDLTGIIVHNLRNPLAWIYSGIGLAQMILPEDTDPDALVGLEKALEGVARLEQQVEVLLNINRAEAGREVSGQEPLKPIALVTDVVELMRPRAEGQRIKLCAILPAELPLVKGNYYVLAWALENLVDNAIKFSPSGGTVRIEAEKAQGGIRIAVKDRGKGIDSAEQRRIFEKFHQVGRSGPKLGTGLGLYFVRLAAGAHGGTVNIESHLGQGSTFSIWLPPLKDID